MNKLDVIGFGALNVDTLLKVERIAGPEEESFIENYTEACGGSAANTMVGLLGLDVKQVLSEKSPTTMKGKYKLTVLAVKVLILTALFTQKRAKAASVWGLSIRKAQEPYTLTPA